VPEFFHVSGDEIGLKGNISPGNKRVFYATLMEESMLGDIVVNGDVRKRILSGVLRSVNSVGMDEEARLKLIDMSQKGPVYEIYIILFAIVRLAGLYEEIAKHTPKSHMRALDSLYIDLNDHLMGRNGHVTCAKQFVTKWAGRIMWYSPVPRGRRYTRSI
tara:strand:+ start:4619 stop:5098 length:480 start_codon:yes stop_codon:yes gene_type:complete